MILAGLDVGSHRVSVAAGRVNGGGGLEILGLGSAPSRGVRGGAIVHLDAAAESIEAALHEAETSCGFPLERIAVGIGDDTVRSFNGRGVVPVMGKEQEVTSTDRRRALQAAQALGIPSDREIIHMIPLEFVLDGQPGIQEPEGMWGVQLEAEVHIVSGLRSVVRNLQKALDRVNARADRFIFTPLAAARAVLHPDEERWGVAVVDLGAQTTGIAVVQDNILRDTAILGVGSEQVTHDLAIGLRTPLVEAEEMKRRIGLSGDNGHRSESLEVTGVGEEARRSVAPSLLTSIIGPRIEEILGLVVRQIQRSAAMPRLQGGIVLTGGGAELAGLCRHAQRILQSPVRIGRPSGFSVPAGAGLDASWSCAVGLLQELASEREDDAGRRKPPLLLRVARPLKDFVKARLAL